MPLVTAKSFTAAFIPAWVVTYLLASMAHTQMILTELLALDINIPVSSWVSTTLHDIWGLLPAYGSAIAAALFIALSITGFITRKYRKHRFLIPIATTLAMLVMLIAMYPIMHITLIAGARSATGLVLQCLAGLAGGLTFLRLHHK